MGLSFHYNGRIAKPELLPELIEEVQEIAGITDWKYTVYQREFQVNIFGKPHNGQNIYGISITPPSCEPIFICFLSNGWMSSPIHMKLYGVPLSIVPITKKTLYMWNEHTKYSYEWFTKCYAFL